MRVALVRHPALRVAPGVCYGRTDYPLADPADIAGIVARLGGFAPEAVIASPAGRCRAVAEAILCPRLVLDARLLELDFGHWEGMQWNAIDRTELDDWAADPVGRAPPGGETGAALIARVGAVFEEIAAASVAIVAHGGPLKVLACLLRGVPIDLLTPAVPMGSVSVFNDRSKV